METLEEPKMKDRTKDPKQVIIMRKDLGMRKGKMISQGAHASMAAIINLGKVEWTYSDLDGSLCTISLHIPLWLNQYAFNGKPDIRHGAVIDWLEGRFTKICVGVDSEQELVDVIDKAKEAGLITSLITDAGLTEFGGVPTITCGCIGPAYPRDVDVLTGHLTLL